MNGQCSVASILDKLQAVARRKNLPKFGMSKEDRPGPNPQTTLVAEDVYMQFIAGKDEADKMETEGEKSALELLKEKASKGVVKCRICKEDHWTTNCPYKVCTHVDMGSVRVPFKERSDRRSYQLEIGMFTQNSQISRVLDLPAKIFLHLGTLFW